MAHYYIIFFFEREKKMSLYEIVLIDNFGEYHFGDVIKVASGLYESLINRKIGLPISEYDEIDDKKKFVINIKDLQEDNAEYLKINKKLYKENTKLKKENKDLKVEIRKLTKLLG